ncbi:hypothetical protein DERP_009713 [Dermatophagoides pteronyssinus]|uniref:CMP/dCMP-type deaminase domain-containing protein n=1 Tax=Dermatophagoides pteronyssinus TaxID=6956 RepID=A0ABQ8JB49_DERPT|nr:hypothetical protein DERP_009713 [Dermatophagoides pteronyssinus]
MPANPPANKAPLPGISLANVAVNPVNIERIPPVAYTLRVQSQKLLYLATLFEPCSICIKHLIRSAGAFMVAVKAPASIPALYI